MPDDGASERAEILEAVQATTAAVTDMTTLVYFLLALVGILFLCGVGLMVRTRRIDQQLAEARDLFYAMKSYHRLNEFQNETTRSSMESVGHQVSAAIDAASHNIAHHSEGEAK